MWLYKLIYYTCGPLIRLIWIKKNTQIPARHFAANCDGEHIVNTVLHPSLGLRIYRPPGGLASAN